MSDKTKTLTPHEARLKRLAVLEELASLYADIEREGGTLPVEVAHAEVVPSDGLIGLANLPLTEAIIDYLKALPPHPQSARKIWSALEAAGVEVTSEDPVRSVEWALRKRRKTHDDVFSAGWGKWDLKSKYTPRKLNNLLKRRAGLGGRTQAEHIELTREGMEKAKASGKTLGAPAKLSSEMKEAVRLHKSGMKIARACREAGIRYTTYYYYHGRYDLDAWDCVTWPPPLRTKATKADASRDADRAGTLRLVK